MNLYAYLATGQVIRLVSGLSAARVNLHGAEQVPGDSIIFVVNHFTRIETLLLPYHIYQLTRVPVWSLADAGLFEGPLGGVLDRIGMLSTKDPQRDQLIVKTLLTGEANWIIYPEGYMVKDKRAALRGSTAHTGRRGRHPHTGAAVLALRTEFYRQRLRWLAEADPGEARRLMGLFGIDALDRVVARKTSIVPVNITYYPLRAQENALSRLAGRLVKDMPEKMQEEIITEGTMLLSGVDIDIRFGQPIEAREYLTSPLIEQDIFAGRRIDFDDRLPSRPKMRQVSMEIMERYMTAIYQLTTVNHDHLFASMLRQFPLRRLDEENLKRRVFLVTTENLEGMGIHLHRSLRTSQYSLLTDDRFNKYREFITLAEEKEVVRRKGGVLIKDPSRLTNIFDINRARLDNPVGVIAQEVVPLTLLQKKIRAAAWLTPMGLRHRIAGYLLEQGKGEFKRDYVEFYLKGESKSPEVGAPFLVRGSSRRVGVLLIHGYLAAPLEVRELAQYLGRQGFWVYAPRLKGHGTSPDDLARRHCQDWQDSVDAGYLLLSSICERVVVGGFSFGGGLAVDLAARVRGVAGVFAVCPPMRLQDISSRLAPAVDLWNRLMDIVHYDMAKKEFAVISPENPHINYARLPIAGVSELERFMAALEPKLAAVRSPALVVQSQGDPVVDPRGSRELFAGLGTADKDYLLVDSDRHGILLGEGAEKVHRLIGDFVARIRRRG